MFESRTSKMVAAGVAGGVLCPVAVIGTVAYLGFGSAGIAAGSIAASMMSAEAVAAGGTIAAGSTVATLQSIGAAGFSAGALSSMVAGGAAVGAGTTALVASGNKKDQTDGNEDKDPVSESSTTTGSLEHNEDNQDGVEADVTFNRQDEKDKDAEETRSKSQKKWMQPQ
mmetsp:Transcript_32327/g.65553  ORF Transcript_32327/g.65553 Transcript_32327/m.65553 type:complete len:169 (+) Transcript_32327:196-702(+)